MFEIFIPEGDFVLRIVISIVLGSIVGIERELTNKSAGLRTNILVCVGSCLFTILSIHGFSNAISVYPMGDPARVAAQILTGIGFIGGGTVLRHGTSIYGLTTAATLWITASIGMACGCGKFGIALVCTLLTFAILTFIRLFEKLFIHNNKNSKNVGVTIISNKENSSYFTKEISDMFPNLTDFTIVPIKNEDDTKDNNEIEISFITNIVNAFPTSFVCKKFQNNDKIINISVKELPENSNL